MKFFFNFLIISLLTILMISSVSAIGISPPSVKTQFSDGKVETFTFTIFANNVPTNIKLSLDGALAEYAIASISEFELPANTNKEVTITLKYPNYNQLTIYGEQRLNVRAEEFAQTGQGFNAITAVVGLIKISIPIPGEHAELNSFTIPSVEKGQNTHVEIIISNKGKEILKDKELTVEIISPTSEKLETVKFSNINILPQTNVTLLKILESKDYVEGKYLANLYFKYSDELAPITKENIFFIGTTDILLENYTKTIIRGEISPIDLTFQSIWGSPLNSVRTTIDFDGKSQSLPPLDFAPFSKTTISTFLDVPSTIGNNTEAELTISIPYNDEIIEKQIPMYFSVIDPIIPENKSFISENILYIGLIIIIILILLTINIYLLTRKKNEKNN